MALSGCYCGSGAWWTLGALREQEKVLAASCTLPAYHFNPNNSKHALPRIHKRVPMCSFQPLTQGD